MITDFPVTVGNANLLDNSYFANPVNQRRETPYPGGYFTIDRWQADTVSVELTPEGIALTNPGLLYQSRLNIETDVANNEPITIQASVGGRIYTVATTAKECGGFDSASLGIEESWGSIRSYLIDSTFRTGIKLLNGSVTIKRLKVEKGSIATPYVPKPYSVELAECVRYYRRIPFNFSSQHTQVQEYDELVPICFDFPMKSTPDINFIKIWDGGIISIAATYISLAGFSVAIKAQSQALMDAHYIIEAVAS